MSRDPRVDAYIARAQPFARPILEHLRAVVHAACPDVEETMKWSTPHFTYKGMMAGMAAFSLSRLGESRTFFEEALNMNRADCDSERYLGLLDSAERRWPDALRRFGVAAKCYEVVTCAYARRAGGLRKRHHRSLEQPHRRQTRRDTRSAGAARSVAAGAGAGGLRPGPPGVAGSGRGVLGFAVRRTSPPRAATASASRRSSSTRPIPAGRPAPPASPIS